MESDRQKALAADARLLRAAAGGDRSAAARLLDQAGPPLLAVARRMLRDEQAAEDVVQEAFLRLWRAAPDWREGEALASTWLHRVALNLCYDRLRRKREILDPDPPEQIDGAPNPEQALAKAQLAGRVRAAVDALPPRQRAAIALCHFEGLGNIEAAEVLDVSVEALESLLSRARRALRSALAADAAERQEGDAR